MPIVAVFEFPDGTAEQYEAVFSIGGAAINEQPARLHHVCYRTGDVGFTVVDTWTDEASFAAFGAVIGPAVAAAGLEPKPVVFPVQGQMFADGVRNP